MRAAVEQLLEEHAGSINWADFRRELLQIENRAAGFVDGFESLSERFLDITYDDERLYDQPEPMLRNIVELSRLPDRLQESGRALGELPSVLHQRLFDAVGPERHEEAQQVVETGRISWRLRDDDNLLVARLQSQLLRALGVAAARLRGRGQLVGGGKPNASDVEALVQALRAPDAAPIALPPRTAATKSDSLRSAKGESARQLIGQPASPGLATGTVRCIRGRDALGRFRRGDVLVCDAIEPTMTHLVPLASAIVERRGGMLIHGSIIARELGIPCVNGVRNAAEVLKDGDFVTVDGHLGIVTVGDAEFDLEREF